ncbi:methyl-accepting chemotaxis protein, partial [Roseibium sp.]|uniref:methyl-accepting chemotaxis protein n=1 Tax=Roseibium sp. TaxID=1936156 RepID=UPI003D0ADFA8
GVQSGAAATEEMTSSIEEIGRQAAMSSSVAQKAVDGAQKTNQSFQELADVAEKVGSVIGLISEIAEQTNLLALNATIEAARAGESGKGFAVVAAEVKELSTQTARATDEISSQIAAVQTSTVRAVEAIRMIGNQMDKVQEVTTAIASAVEEQGAATGEISQAMSMAANSSTQASENVAGLQDTIDATRSSSDEIDGLSKSLTEVSRTLSDAVEDFLSAQVWQHAGDGRGAEAA